MEDQTKLVDGVASHCTVLCRSTQRNAGMKCYWAIRKWEEQLVAKAGTPACGK